MFTIQNLGNANLNLTGTPMVGITGTDASMFSVITQPLSPVGKGGNTTFSIVFTPTSAGQKKNSCCINS
jgi:hypothetical protein